MIGKSVIRGLGEKYMTRSFQMGTDSEGICSLVIASKEKHQQKDVWIFWTKRRILWMSVSIFPQSPLSLYSELVKKVAMEAGMVTV